MKNLLIFILIAGGIFVGIGFWQGWFTATKTDSGAGISLEFHGDKLAGDWDEATTTIAEVAKAGWAKVKGLVSEDAEGRSVLEGTVVKADAAQHVLTVEAKGETAELPILAKEKLDNLDALVGKKVRLQLEEKDGAAVIRKIEVLDGP